MKKLGLTIASILFISLLYTPARGATPIISYVSPSNGATFVDVIPGEGVNWTVTITDPDGDLQRVVLQSNSSGSWQVFYDSGDLGGVSYHNASGINPDWTGSWKTYYWKICAKDSTGWNNVTYSFTTEYVFGQPHCIALYDGTSSPVLYKNSTTYFLWFTNGSKIFGKKALYMNKLLLQTPMEVVDGECIYNTFTFNNSIYAYYYKDGYLRWFNKTGYSGSTDIQQAKAYGADVEYFDGRYILSVGTYQPTESLSTFFSNSPLTGFTYQTEIHGGGNETCAPSLNTLKGKLVLTYIYKRNTALLGWAVYDGEGWKRKSSIDYGFMPWLLRGSSTTKDPINNQLVTIYIKEDFFSSSQAIYYRVLTDPDGAWSSSHIAYKAKSGEKLGTAYATFINDKLVIIFTSTIRGKYNIYVITAPDYTIITGTDKINRIQFPDASLNQKHVNSTVFAIKNINDRPILNITWHVGNIGDIETANNVRVWSNMSGTWQSWLVGSDHNTTTIDISAYKGSEWLPGETLYWKIEIIDVNKEGIFSEDCNIWYKIGIGG